MGTQKYSRGRGGSFRRNCRWSSASHPNTRAGSLGIQTRVSSNGDTGTPVDESAPTSEIARLVQGPDVEGPGVETSPVIVGPVVEFPTMEDLAIEGSTVDTRPAADTALANKTDVGGELTVFGNGQVPSPSIPACAPTGPRVLLSTWMPLPMFPYPPASTKCQLSSKITCTARNQYTYIALI